MDLGIFPLMQQRHADKHSRTIVAEAVEQVCAADRLGFSRAWFPEHHFSNYSLCPSPLMMAAHCAGLTKYIRLGSAVSIAPLYSPPRLLAEIGFVDCLSSGRLDFGLGLGYQQFEFERFGVSLNNRLQATNEILDMIEMSFSQPSFSYQGQQFAQLETKISVEPIQKPHPPIWIVGSDPGLMRRAIKLGYKLFVTGSMGDHHRLEAMRRDIDAAAVAVGVDPASVKVGLLRFGFASDNRAEVEHYVESARYQQRIAQGLKSRKSIVKGSYFVEEQPLSGELSLEEARAILPVGNVEICIERIVQDAQAVGADHVAIQTMIGDMPQAAMLRSMERWAEQVLPAANRALAAVAVRPAAPVPVAAGI